MPHSNSRDGTPSAAEFGSLRAYLTQVGVSQEEITAVIGNGAQGRSRAEIVEELRVWLKALPISEEVLLLSEPPLKVVREIGAEVQGLEVEAQGSLRTRIVEKLRTWVKALLKGGEN